jgi:diadenosine tetraphosphatase ApaH/serine/threonine PP2A family protein phosphatase
MEENTNTNANLDEKKENQSEKEMNKESEIKKADDIETPQIDSEVTEDKSDSGENSSNINVEKIETGLNSNENSEISNDIPSEEEKKSLVPIDESKSQAEPSEEEKKSLELPIDESKSQAEPSDEMETAKVEDAPIIKEPIEIEEPKKNWKPFDLDSGIGFSKLKSALIETILKQSKNISPIIQKMFERIISVCDDNFDFGKENISFEEYLGFWKEVNRLVPKLEKRIPVDDCYGSIFFVGDSHGSIEDTFLVLNFFTKVLRANTKTKFVFVGDYEDRNPNDLENLTLVVAFYLLCPDNVVLIRGNHEDRTINTHYGFVDNLLRAFWEKGEELYEQIIPFFTRLPIAHISQMYDNEDNVKARIFSVHGGIPIDQWDFLKPLILSEIEDNLTCEVEKSEDMDPYSVSMLWADPDEMIQGIVTDDQGSGRLRFGAPVLNGFLAANNLHVVVRGHQKWNEGYKIFFEGRLYSLFSTSKYDDKKKFNPKILHLELGQPPEIIKIDEMEFDKIFTKIAGNSEI